MARRRKKSRLGGLVRGVLALAVIAGAGAVLLRVAGVELGFLPEGLFRTEEALPAQGEDSGAESAAGQPPADAPPVIRLARASITILPGPVSKATTSSNRHPAGSRVTLPMPPMFCRATVSVSLR